MPISFLNTNNTGGIALLNNNNSGKLGLSVASTVNYVTNGLLFNLDMKNWTSGTTWPDNSGNGNNFTFYLNPNNTTNGTVSNAGTDTAYWYCPANNGAVAASAILPANTNYSKGAMIYLTVSSINNIIGSTAQETFWGQASNTIRAGNNNGDGYGAVIATSTLANATWYYVSMTFSGTAGWTLYINGAASGTSATTTNRAAASTPQIFSYAGNGNQSTGKIAVAHLYTRALTAAEHLQNYNYYSTRYNGSTPA
jgi:hypothetical protein